MQVDILDIGLRQDWGYNFVKPLSGGLPGEFDEESHITIKLTKKKMRASCPGEQDFLSTHFWSDGLHLQKIGE